VFNQWSLYRDIAKFVDNSEMLIDAFWYSKDFQSLSRFKNQIKVLETTKYQLYYTYLIINEQPNNGFDEIFKKAINLAYKEWDQYLPNYVDRIQFENLIMFQLVMESSEGGRNMIKEATSAMERDMPP